MIQIEKFEVRYFRSIYSATVKGMADFDVISGKNDSGKSNFLKALNLFFNNHTDWRTPIDFKKDFSRRRLREVRRDTIKGKQYIQIKVHFIRGSRYQGSLPEKFSVTRTWHRDSATPTEKNSLRENNIPGDSLHRALASLQRYLNTVQYEYVPAIKDRAFFSYSLGILQDAVLQMRADEGLRESVDSLLLSVQEEVDALRVEFKDVTGVDFSMSLPNEVAELFRAFIVLTGDENDLPLTVRGDGIQSRFLPSLLHHVAINSKKYYIWGFEEPENCLEHGMATDLAGKMLKEYAIESQILVTSHSHAFITLDDSAAQLYRVLPGDMGSEIEMVDISDPDTLMDDLGLLALQKRHQQEYVEQMKEIQAAHDLVSGKLAEYEKPILLVEGKTDVVILNEAWSRIYADPEPPFKITSCDVAGSADQNTKAGGGVLRKALESCRADMPKTVGLFDYDDGGLKEYRALRNFSEEQDGLRKHTNNNAAAITLPNCERVSDYYESENLCIEYFLPEQCLIKRKNRQTRYLKFKYQDLKTVVGNKVVEVRAAEDKRYRKIDEGKVDFVENAIPNFDDEDFWEFEVVFGKIFEAFRCLGADLT